MTKTERIIKRALRGQCRFERVVDHRSAMDWETRRCQLRHGHKGKHEDIIGKTRGLWGVAHDWQD